MPYPCRDEWKRGGRQAVPLQKRRRDQRKSGDGKPSPYNGMLIDGLGAHSDSAFVLSFLL